MTISPWFGSHVKHHFITENFGKSRMLLQKTWLNTMKKFQEIIFSKLQFDPSTRALPRARLRVHNLRARQYFQTWHLRRRNMINLASISICIQNKSHSITSSEHVCITIWFNVSQQIFFQKKASRREEKKTKLIPAKNHSPEFYFYKLENTCFERIKASCSGR